MQWPSLYTIKPPLPGRGHAQTTQTPAAAPCPAPRPAAGISLDAYAARLLRYCKCSPVCFVAAFAYMARLQRGGGGTLGGPLRVDGLTAHRLMAVGAVVATKFFDDKARLLNLVGGMLLGLHVEPAGCGL